jgi:hypothetical protein
MSNMDYIDYIVVESYSKEDLERQVNRKIREGYIPTTQLSVASSSTTVEYGTFIGTRAQKAEHRTVYAQGMLKQENYEKND